VPFASDGTPEAAIVAALTADGTRALVRTTDEPVIEAMLESDPLGWPVTVAGPDRLEAGHGVAAGGK
jgi:acetyl-CoA C-acetyltransferase